MGDKVEPIVWQETYTMSWIAAVTLTMPVLLRARASSENRSVACCLLSSKEGQKSVQAVSLTVSLSSAVPCNSLAMAWNIFQSQPANMATAAYITDTSEYLIVVREGNQQQWRDGEVT